MVRVVGACLRYNGTHMHLFSLLAVKVFVGINLLGFAYRRYASMTTRDTVETEKDKEMKEMNKSEEASMTIVAYFPLVNLLLY